MEKQINDKIIEIVHQANDMIPVEWDDLYIVIEMDKTYSGEAYFYFKYKNEYHYHLEMSDDFGLSMMEVLNENTVLFEKCEELKKYSLRMIWRIGIFVSFIWMKIISCQSSLTMLHGWKVILGLLLV